MDDTRYSRLLEKLNFSYYPAYSNKDVTFTALSTVTVSVSSPKRVVLVGSNGAATTVLGMTDFITEHARP
jgi:ABC-type polysaccharide/polyol phosphate transport system ATPase subunit